jgi:hypothetical protein
VQGLCDLQHRIVRAATASKRAFDLYSLATQTQGGSWLAVQQLLFREVYDEQKVFYDPSYRPLTTWAEKVAAALVACEQANALSKDGAPMGPVSLAVTKALQRRQYTGGGGGHHGKTSSKSEAYDDRQMALRGRPRGRGGSKGLGKAGKAHKPKPSSARQLDAGAGQAAAGVPP